MRLRTALFILALFPGVALAQDYYGAIAYSDGSKAHGWANDYPSRAAAEKAALTICRKHAEDCRAALWFRNGCGALAIGANGPGWAWGETQAVAEKEAVKLCTQKSTTCSIERSICTSLGVPSAPK
jgi:serine/threonine-protein kinase